MFVSHASIIFFFFFNDTATTEIYTLSLHDALPISIEWENRRLDEVLLHVRLMRQSELAQRSEEHTSELQSQSNLVCRLLLEKKKKTHYPRAQLIALLLQAPHVPAAIRQSTAL